MDPWEMLNELLEQDQFELLLPENRREGDDLKIVYLMNDAVESFLVLKKARMTGNYQPDYEGELSFSCGRRPDDEKISEKEYVSSNGEEYYLVVHQGENVVTIFFEALDKVIELYNYSRIAHFWVPGYEYLRQLEYRIAIMRDKLLYLGESTCTPEEIPLAELAYFPPLNATCYPAVPAKYFTLREDAWTPSEKAIELMRGLAQEVQDKSMVQMLTIYQKLPTRWLAKRIAAMLHRTSHAKLVDLITKRIEEAAAGYPDRDFGPALNQRRQELMARAAQCQKAFAMQGIRADILTEEPFRIAQDSIVLSVYLMIWAESKGSQIVKVQPIEYQI